MGPDMNAELSMADVVKPAEDPASIRKKKKRKREKRSAQLSNGHTQAPRFWRSVDSLELSSSETIDETSQKRSVEFDGHSVRFNVAPFSSKQKVKSESEGLEGFANGIEQPKESWKRRKLEPKDCTQCEISALAHGEDKGNYLEKKTKKKGKKLHSQMHGAEKVQADVSKKRIVAEDDGMLQVHLSGTDAHKEKFRPFESFLEVSAPKMVMECCNGFEKPFPIQAYGWPFLLDGRDFIGIATTGSGKTLAFGIPALVHVLNRTQKGSKLSIPTCLVLSPTRELAQQISEVLVEAGRPCGVRTSCFYGGTSKKPQYTALKLGVDIIVATPGRLQDLVEEGCCALQNVSFVVLDEADRMLDLGFEESVRAIICQTSKSRQTIMFSATWPSDVDLLAKEFLGEDSIKVTVGPKDLVATHSVTQIVEVIDSSLRDGRLLELLIKYHKSKRNRILVFVLYKKEAVRVEAMLQRRGWKVSAVHGDKGQCDRNNAVLSFKDGTCPLLIATDVAARGLDIPDVEYVINYSFPLTTEDYVHRIGRTGRAGKTGIAHTFFTFADKARAGELVNVLKQAGQTIPLELLKFGTSVKKKESKLYGAHFRELALDAPKAKKITFDSDEE